MPVNYVKLSPKIQVYRQVSSIILLKFQCCGAVIIAEGTGSEVNPRVDLPLALVVLALPRVCLLPSIKEDFFPPPF